MKADILRDKFLNFFKARKHRVVESDSLVPRDDPTVLFTPAGMNQFKRQFLGHLTGFSRAATSQRCLRTDDLDKVGKTCGHHTFFEMLGNFSFGNYFKEEAIVYAWEFLTQELKIPKDRLWVSVYKDDDEAYKIWKDKIKLPENKIVKLGDKENFWPSEAKQKGPNGPCGPCSEIFFDQVEVWNLVFTQFNRKEGGALEPLPKKNIDTGMGLERLAAVTQGVKNNFETDLFQPIIKEICSSAQDAITQGKEPVYAVSDHIRAIVFAVYDGVLPANDGRGYVVRKLIRKSVLHLRQSLGMKKPFLHKLVPIVAEIMKVPYPELSSRRENIAQLILAEEKNFIATLESGKSLFEDKFKDLAKENDSEEAGLVAFELYDTYGIPFELTKGWASKNGISISEDRFNQELARQKTRSKTQSAMKGDVFDIKELHLSGAKTSFLGYAKYETKAKIVKIIKDSAPVKKVSKGEEVKVILDKTVFYPESGGQLGDTGKLIKGKNIFQVKDTQKFDKVIVHKGVVLEGVFKPGDELKSCVDIERRLAIARNHTATHLLQAALRKVLGAHVQQQGSLVAEDRLRFDFTHFKDIGRDELARIEEEVNSYIINNNSLKTKTLTLREAKKQGALAFFGEKYEQKVRMVAVGDFSKELCGGTHLESSGQIGLFKIISEGSIASGVRRIEAVTGETAYKRVKEDEGLLGEVCAILGVPAEKLTREIQKRLTQIKELEKKLNAQGLDAIKGSLDGIIGEAQDINNIKVIARSIENMDMDLLRKTVDLIKEKTGNAVIALGSVMDKRALLVMGVTPDLIAKGFDASALIRDIAKTIGGSGGGRKDFAQAGGNNPERLGVAFQELKNIINNTK
ncbi:MAG: alanine--tRNA ligase [Candidatus Omnitrophota bacterium]